VVIGTYFSKPIQGFTHRRYQNKPNRYRLYYIPISGVGLYIVKRGVSVVRKEVVREYWINKPTRVDSKVGTTQLVDCDINKSKTLGKTKDGFYLPLLNNLECFLLSCKLRLQDQQYNPKVCIVTIWFKDGADISNYFRQARKHLRNYLDHNDKKDKEAILHYHGQREKHSSKADEHCHFAIVFDSNTITAKTLRDILRKPTSYFRNHTTKPNKSFHPSEKKVPKLPFVSYKLKPFVTNSKDSNITKANPLATYGIKRALPDAMSHLAYLCKVQQKQYVSRQPLSSKHSLNQYLREHDIPVPVPTEQPASNTKYKDGELKSIRKEDKAVTLKEVEIEECVF